MNLKFLMTRSKQIRVNMMSIEATTISALSKELNKYEYLTGENLGYKPKVVKQVKFEYSLLGKVFNKGFKKEGKRGLLKRLKQIEGKNKEQLDEIEYQGQRQLDMINKHGKKQLELINKQEEQLKKSTVKRND